jgi:hypothetical protein
LENVVGPTEEQLIPLADDGLCDSACLLELSRNLSVHARRDLHAAVERHGPAVAFAADTALGLAAGRREFPYTPLNDSDLKSGMPAGRSLIADSAARTADAVGGACGDAERAMSTAGVLARVGYTDSAVLAGGPADYVAAHDRCLGDNTQAARS